MQEVDFITWIYCFVDDVLSTLLSKTKRLRARGAMPQVTDAEIITMEIAGEFLGMSNNKAIWQYFRTHWLTLFPQLGSRSQFSKQANNLYQLKQVILQKVFARHQTETAHIIDGFPLPVTHFKRACNSKNFKGEASFGYCASKDEKYYGFKCHVLTTIDGEIAGFQITQANESEREVAAQLTENKVGQLFADKGYLGDKIKEQLAAQGIELITPVRHNMKDPIAKPLRQKFNRLRRKVETTIGQLAERFTIQKTKARTYYSLLNRLSRKVLAHCLCGLINKEHGRAPLKFALLLQN